MALTAAARRVIPADDFAGPNRSFPVDTPKRANSAYKLAGHAADPDAVRAKIKVLAAKKGVSSALPKTATAGHGMARMRVGG